MSSTVELPAKAIGGLITRGHRVKASPRFDTEFGCAQMAMKVENGYIAASDHRKNGFRLGCELAPAEN